MKYSTGLKLAGVITVAIGIIGGIGAAVVAKDYGGAISCGILGGIGGTTFYGFGELEEQTSRIS